eukprot:scaffold16312_cov107-Isochrysis_galbana.AAC.2
MATHPPPHAHSLQSVGRPPRHRGRIACLGQLVHAARRGARLRREGVAGGKGRCGGSRAGLPAHFAQRHPIPTLGSRGHGAPAAATGAEEDRFYVVGACVACLCSACI